MVEQQVPECMADGCSTLMTVQTLCMIPMSDDERTLLVTAFRGHVDVEDRLRYAYSLQYTTPAEMKRLIGARLFPKIQVVEPRLAGKITGMLLEMDNAELLVLLSEQRALMNKIYEALAVLKDHQENVWCPRDTDIRAPWAYDST